MNSQPQAHDRAPLRWLIAFVLVGCLTAILVQWSRASKLREENQRLREQAEKLQTRTGDSEELQRLRAENQELERLRKDNRELLRLRNEVRQLREQTKELARLGAENKRLRTALEARANQPPAQLALDSEAGAKAIEKAESILCVKNLKQIGLAARIWANDNNNDVLPSDFVTMKDEETFSPKILACPSDKTKTVAANWNEFNAANSLSYKMLSPGATPNDPQKVFVRCPYHGHVCLVDGSVQQGVLQKQ